MATLFQTCENREKNSFLEKIKRNILIVCHGFPPNPGIAGRRWAKFAKYLKKEGYGVYVIASENIHEQVSDWTNDIAGIEVEYLPFSFPESVVKRPVNLIDKIIYRLSIIILKLLNKGNYFDRSYFWEKKIRQNVSHYIKTKAVDTVIVTSGPFLLSYYVTKLKEEFPEVKFIADFRDLWTGDKEITSFSSLDVTRVAKEKILERKTIIHADTILTVAESMTAYFHSLAINKEIITIPNGYDQEDFGGLDSSVPANDNKIRLVFAGTLYINLRYILDPFFKALSELKLEDAALYNRLSIEFYGTFPAEYISLINKYQVSDIVTRKSRIPLKEIYGKIKNSSACLLFLNDVYNFALSTKFCEYISQDKKIIVVSNMGPTAEFIIKNKLGFWIPPTNTLIHLKEVLRTIQSEPQLPTTFNIKDYSLQTLTGRLINVIENRPTSERSAYKTRNILFTFDYELFLGERSGTVENCMIIPTEKLLDILSEFELKNALFFVDTVFLHQLQLLAEKHPNVKDDLEKIKTQLCKILKYGHYIFPHIHPHWLDASYNSETNQWSLSDLSKYRFHHINENEKELLFEQSIQFIQNLQRDCGVYHPIDGFRAGGWCIQPFEDFKPYFEKHGIRHDFSVLRDFSLLNSNFYYNFTSLPDNAIYNFRNHVEHEDKTGPFKEYTISAIQPDNWTKLMSRVQTRWEIFKGSHNFGDGLSVAKTEEGIIKSASMDIKFEPSEMITIDFMNQVKADKYFEQLDDHNYLQFISHPKMFSEYGLKTFKEFLKKVKSNYILETDFRNMK